MEVHFFSEQRFKRLKTINNVLFNCKTVINFVTAEQFFLNIVQEKMGRKKASREATARYFQSIDTSVPKLPQEEIESAAT